MIPREIVIKGSFKYTEKYGIDVKKDPFPWFLLSLLLAARISENIALRTFELFLKYGLTDPENIVRAGWDNIVEVLDEGGYTRYDFKTAAKIIDICRNIINEGGLAKIIEESENTSELLGNLRRLGSGIGPVTIGIFLRELGNDKFQPIPDQRVMAASRNLGIDPLNYSIKENIDYGYVENFLSAVGKNCIRKKCDACSVRSYCIAYSKKV